MADRIAKYVLELGGDATDLNAVFAGIKSRVRSDVAELKSITSKVELFGGIQDSLPQVQRALDSAKQKVKDFTAEIERIKTAGGKPTKELTDGLAAAEKAAAAATKELAKQQQQLAALDQQLTKAGVNTKALATEQLRLAEASKVAADAAAQTAAKQALGLTTLKDIAPEVARLRAQFDLLKNSGTLSATETAAAQRQLDARIKELNASVTTAGGSFKSLQAETRATFTPLLLQATAVVAALGTVGAALSAVTDAAKAYRQGLAEAGAVTNLTKDQLGSLGAEVRVLATEFGVDLQAAIKGVTELLRSGVSRDNAMEVLRASAVAAKAATAELGDGVKVANILIDGFGLSVDQLPRAFDSIIQGAKEGGATLSEFANSFGPLANIAQANNVSLEQVTATLAVMIDKGIDAGQAASDLGKIIQKLGSPEVRGKLAELGVTSKDLVGIFTELGRKGLSLTDIIDLGIGNAKNAAAVAALTVGSGELAGKLDAVTKAAGAAGTALDALADSPKEKADKLNAAFNETKVQLGEIVGAGSPAAVVLTKILTAFNELSPAAKQAGINLGPFGGIFAATIANMLGFLPAAEKVVAGAAAIKPAADTAAASLKRINDEIAKLKPDVEKFSTALAGRVQALQKATADEIVAINERLAAEIAGLDKSTAANVETAAKIAELQKAAAIEKLDRIKKDEADILAATTEAVNARVALLRAEGKNAADIQQAATQLRIAGNQTILASYRGLYADLKAQAEQSAAAINQIDSSRIAFNEGIEQALRASRLEGLSGLQQYAEKQAEVDRLIAKGRQTAATEGIAAAEKYFNQAKTISESVKGQVLSDGTVVVSSFEAQQTSLRLLKKTQEEYNTASAGAKDAAKQGADGTKEQFDQVREKIKEVSKEIAALQKNIGDGLAIKVDVDAAALAQATAQLDQLTADRTVRVRVQYVGADGGPAPAPAPTPGFNRGGPVWRQFAAQQFANGGPVFNRPSWSKVPGVGNGDTVPALLNEGSFVVRKAASQKYGDGVMSMLAKGYAAGGAVSGTNAQASAILQYAKYILTYLRHPIFEQSRRVIGDSIILAEKGGISNKGLMDNLLKSVQFAAQNFALQDAYGKTAIGGGTFGTRQLPDFEEWMASRPKPRRFAMGGNVGTDTVPAMLTPGEWVIPAPVAHKLGGGFLTALNNMKIPAPSIPRFATGGPVGSVPDRGSAAGIGGLTINIHGAPADFANESAIRRMLVPALRNIQRRT